MERIINENNEEFLIDVAMIIDQTFTATMKLLLRRTACTFLSLIINVSRNGAAAQRKTAAVSAPLRSLRETKIFE